MAGGANTPALARDADALRRANDSIAQRSRSAVLELYSIDTRLQRARANLATIHDRREALARERASVQTRLNVARTVLRDSQRRLAFVVHTLYEQQATDPLAVMLGAASLDEALTSLDDLSRAAMQNQQIASQSRDARKTLNGLSRRLAREERTLRALEDAAARTAASLSAAQAEHQSYISSLAAKRRLNQQEIAQLDQRARSSAAKSVALSAPAGTTAPTGAPAAPPQGGRTMTVLSTGYALRGTTATGLPVGWGIVAVDPSVIPLGTKMTIPGYGEGVAADTGSAVRGAIIDLWFPTTWQALQWGKRMVTITLH